MQTKFFGYFLKDKGDWNASKAIVSNTGTNEWKQFAFSGNNVLSFVSNTLKEDLTIAGPVIVNLFVSTSSTDADFVVKIIDIVPAEKINSSKGTQKIEKKKFPSIEIP